MKQKVYISGKITGVESLAPELFDKAEKELQAMGFETVNPMTINHDHDKSWHSYMKADVKALCECDAIYMLANWTESKGAIIEHTIAMYLGLKVKYESACPKCGCNKLTDLGGHLKSCSNAYCDWDNLR